MSNPFILSDLIDDYNNNDYDALINKIDISLNNIISNSYNSNSDISFIKDVYTFSSILKSQNKQKINELNETLQRFKNIDKNDFNLNNENVKQIKNLVSQNKKQNMENVKIFLETYLYVILKIIFIGILLILVYKYSEITIFAFSFSQIYKGVKNKLTSIKNNGLEIKNRLNNKVQELQNKDPTQKLPKRSILNNFNTNVKDSIKSRNYESSRNSINSKNSISTKNTISTNNSVNTKSSLDSKMTTSNIVTTTPKFE